MASNKRKDEEDDDIPEKRVKVDAQSENGDESAAAFVSANNP